VEGVGGELTLMVKFPDRPPVILTGLGKNTGEVKITKEAKKRAGKTAKSKAVAHRAA
jgi:hypothetical protein